jgi:hypothetical protein
MKSVLYTHIWLSLIAIFLAFESIQLFPGIDQSLCIALFAGTATLFAYNAHTLAVIYLKDVKNELTIWAIKHIAIVWTFCTVGLTSSLYLLYFYITTSQMAVLAVSVISWLLYEGYIIVSSKHNQRILLKLPFIKNLTLAFVWLAITSLLPISKDGFPWIGNTDYILILVVRYFTFFLVTILFDYRDVSSDIITKVKTMPTKFGINTTAYIGYTIAVMILFVLPFLQVQSYFVIIKIIQMLMLFFFLRIRNNTSFQASMLLWDGVLILSPITSFCIM